MNETSRSHQHHRNTDAVVALARRKSEATAKKVDEAIRELIKSQTVINFNTVAVTAGVSKSYLYKTPSVRDRIQTLRGQQHAVNSPQSLHREMSDASKDATIEMLREKNRRLHNENEQLRRQVRQLLGQQYDQIGQ
ncbi:MAG: transposase [Sulfobacillus thermosulfidooxidans]|uniref:Transposase n=1 Tax=Sulfobacillus thermosulfidooxidans TaxID=28034 RepID=A0A2T2WQ12_SULTH|nr:MAG: transposase [Sulfobacillus thermosulfidooxidans]